jgi:hypothetical protein
MNNAERYKRDSELFLQELAADTELQEQTIQQEREAAWKFLEKIYQFTARWKSKNYTPEKMERMKQRRIDILLSEDHQG